MTNRTSDAIIHPRAYYPALDGLRALAFLSVFLFHYAVFISPARILRWGWIGVDVFFVLSGFLITGILYDSLPDPRFFRNFYIRRTLRIFPLYYAFWLVLLLLTPVLGILWNRYNFAMAAYVGNFFYAGSLVPLHPNPGFINFARLMPKGGTGSIEAVPLWSLCVEEQFYLVWPFVVWFVRSRRALLGICIAVFLASPLLRELYWHLWPATAAHGATYYNTLTRADTLLTGAALALWLRDPDIAVKTLRRTAYLLLLLPLPTLLLITKLTSAHWHDSTFSWMNDHFINTAGFSLIALFGAGLLLLAMQTGSWLYRLLHTRPLLAIGRRAYGLYLLHAVPLQMLAIHLLPRLRQRGLGYLFLPLGLTYTFTAAWLSFRFLESPFLRLKDRLAPKPSHVSDPRPL